jgi:hypothetical protein
MALDIKQVLYFVDAKSVGQTIDDYPNEAKGRMRVAKVKMFFVVNPGAVFIALFAALVFMCAYLLVLEGPGSQIIDSVALLAYCFLAVGIVLQAVGFIRAKGLEGRM